MTENRPQSSATLAGATPSPLHRSTHHESAALHVTGRARYIDDLPDPPGAVWCALVTSPHAHA